MSITTKTAKLNNLTDQEDKMNFFTAIFKNVGRGTIIAGVACLGAITAGTTLTASGQEFPPGDVIAARKTLMSVIARNMYPLDEMIYTGKINLPRGRAAADSISAMLQAFPFLFPPSTNTWTPTAVGDPARATFADPHIWQQLEFFNKEVQASAKYAFNASRAESEAEFRKSITELRQTCDTCHAAFQKNN
jgi:cytochrome c556